MLFLESVKDQFPNLKNIFEIGAHRGNDIFDITSMWPNANVYAFEADPTNFSILSQKFVGHDRVHTYHMAVTDTTGSVTFNRYYPLDTINDEDTFIGQNYQNTGQGSILKPGKGMKEIFKVNDVHQTFEVESINLFDFCNRFDIDSIDAIFMDVQGAEYNVFIGCQSMINTLKATIFEWSKNYIMYEGERSFDDISTLLNNNGLIEINREYQFFEISGDSLFVRK